MFAESQAGQKNDNDSKQGKDQGIGKPSFTPLGQAQAEPGESSIRWSCLRLGIIVTDHLLILAQHILDRLACGATGLDGRAIRAL